MRILSSPFSATQFVAVAVYSCYPDDALQIRVRIRKPKQALVSNTPGGGQGGRIMDVTRRQFIGIATGIACGALSTKYCYPSFLHKQQVFARQDVKRQDFYIRPRQPLNPQLTLVSVTGLDQYGRSCIDFCRQRRLLQENGSDRESLTSAISLSSDCVIRLGTFESLIKHGKRLDDIDTPSVVIVLDAPNAQYLNDATGVRTRLTNLVALGHSPESDPDRVFDSASLALWALLVQLSGNNPGSQPLAEELTRVLGSPATATDYSPFPTKFGSQSTQRAQRARAGDCGAYFCKA